MPMFYKYTIKIKKKCPAAAFHIHLPPVSVTTEAVLEAEQW
jgi:hypothetical protein